MSTSEKDTVAAAVAVEGVACNNLLAPNTRLDNAIANSRENKLPEIAVSPLQGQFLAIQCQLIGAKTVLEIGTLGGYSTIWLAETGAKVTSIEIDPKHRDVALQNVAGLDVEIILGAALDVLPKLAAEGRRFDMVFCDASWGEQEKYFDWAVKLTRPKGCIYVDNVVWNALDSGAVESGKDSLLTHVGKDKRVKATLVPMISTAHTASRGRTILDGFLLAVVN
ncbi:O-methyltransferase [Colletotrichum higginsianum]|uniref:O-methyltransferase n=2 Tax=Colletotrichum higginsianum TaxID=80884 RepID=H1VSN2_COLHI|nr:O-methyltransferase [Colletotrichum higginsianum IMI 349063]OBR05522.1 O-methyltransferase [Colletotrichum higginsianum IMI 349063]TIC93698.1 putative O-methyltransferase [Colletotrichum higginsianum]GJD00155.1 O-Methyltransferase [Colletotrichum higginsianum]CCF43240.1 O-methyltransferase [Colletotrichum higginsianum]